MSARKVDAGATTVAAAPPGAKANVKTASPDADRATWEARLIAAQGDDAALLQLALNAPPWQTRLAAVHAITGEEMLRQAERALRHHDSRVHGAARQRLQAAAAHRATGIKAQALIDCAAALAQQRPLAVNHLVALDRDWSALDTQYLVPEQLGRFAELRGGLDALLRALDEARQQALERAAAEVRALAEADAEARRSAEAPGAGRAAGAMPDDARSDGPSAATNADARAAGDGANVTGDAPGPAPASPAPGPEAVREPVPRPSPRRPDPEQLAALDALLQQAAAAAEAGQTSEMQLHMQALDSALAALDGAVLDGRRRQRHQSLQAEWTRLKGWQRWGGHRARDELVDEAEALARMTRLALGGDLLPAVAAPVDGGVAPDPGIPQPSSQPECQSEADAAPSTRRHAAPKLVPKLALKSHGEAIQALRKRWKDLDRLGTAANQTLWRRFDGALHTAYQPVAAHLAALQAERQANLLARNALLDELDAVAGPDGGPSPGCPAGDHQAGIDDAEPATRGAPEGGADASGDADGSDDAGDTGSLKAQLRALDRFHTAWRQLGPLEHTVPAPARDALQRHMQRSVERLQAPLEQARRAAEARREALIQRAQVLLEGSGRERAARPAPPRDAALRVRELQAQWQQQARSLPLARAVESALWARFKAATDAVFAQREAAFSARDAELAANLAAREALLERLAALPDDAPGADIRQALAEADRAWHEPIELPRHAVAAIEPRHRALRAALSQRLAGATQRDWHAQCDALAARLALCELRENTAAEGSGDSDDLAHRWGALGALPAAWQQALAARWAGPAVAGPLPDAAFDALLLELEARLELPASPEQQAARRLLKLQALQHALQRRGVPGTPAATPALPADALAAALRQGGAAPAQRARLLRLVAALRDAPAGTTLSGAR